MTEERFAGIVIPADLKRAWADVQAKADALGHPVKHRVDLHIDGHVAMTDETWVYPTASRDQWSIIDGQPVRATRDHDSYDPALGKAVRDPTLEPAPVATGPSPLSPAYLTDLREWAFTGTTRVFGRANDLDLLADVLLAHDYWQAIAEANAAEVARLREQVAFYMGCAEAAADADAEGMTRPADR